jgi:biotin carboxyl carrier protein
VTLDVEVGGQRRLVTIDVVGAATRSGGRFRVRLKAVPADAASPPALPDDMVELDVRATDLGLSLVDCATGRVVDAAVTEQTAGEWLVQLPAVSLTAIVDGRLGRARRDPGGPSGTQHVTAPMPGRVVRVLVQPGDEVRARQGLVVIEAMKMENELTAARSGRVREVTVGPGAAVETGRLLVVIE